MHDLEPGLWRRQRADELFWGGGGEPSCQPAQPPVPCFYSYRRCNYQRVTLCGLRCNLGSLMTFTGFLAIWDKMLIFEFNMSNAIFHLS